MYIVHFSKARDITIRAQINLFDKLRVDVTKLIMSEVTLARKTIQVAPLVMAAMLVPLILKMSFFATTGSTKTWR